MLYFVEQILNSLKTKDNKQKKLKQDLIITLNECQIEYKFNTAKKKIERLLDPANIKIINCNIIKLHKSLQYNECIEEFLQYKDINKIKSLTNIQKILYSVLESKQIGTNKLKQQTNKIKTNFKNEDLSKIYSETDKDTLENLITKNSIYYNLKFIQKNIHHNDPKQYKFGHNEYVFWWLMINSMIYIFLRD